MNDDNINFAMIKYNNGPGFREQLNQKQCFAWNNQQHFSGITKFLTGITEI